MPPAQDLGANVDSAALDPSRAVLNVNNLSVVQEQAVHFSDMHN